MNSSLTFRFNRRSILRVFVIIGVGYALTAIAVGSLAQSIPPGVVPDETSVHVYAANYPSPSWSTRVAVKFRAVQTANNQAPNVTGRLPAGDSVGVASSQLGFYPNP